MALKVMLLFYEQDRRVMVREGKDTEEQRLRYNFPLFQPQLDRPSFPLGRMEGRIKSPAGPFWPILVKKTDFQKSVVRFS